MLLDGCREGSRFYLLEGSGSTYQYAFRDTALDSLAQGKCEACGRTRSRWRFSGPHRFLLEGGPKYPDRLEFTGAGGAPLLLSRRAADVFKENGITYYMTVGDTTSGVTTTETLLTLVGYSHSIEGIQILGAEYLCQFGSKGGFAGSTITFNGHNDMLFFIQKPVNMLPGNFQTVHRYTSFSSLYRILHPVTSLYLLQKYPPGGLTRKISRCYNIHKKTG